MPTPLGEFTACFTDRGLAGIRFPTSSPPCSLPAADFPSAIRAWATSTQAALVEVLSGRAAPELPPLDLSAGSPFQREVWLFLRSIPSGQTRTYGEVAAGLGRPKAARPVGQACGANPIPVVIPCHRVLAAGNRLGGFSGGLDWKRRLLHLERDRDFPSGAPEPSVIHGGLCVGCPELRWPSAGSAS